MFDRLPLIHSLSFRLPSLSKISYITPALSTLLFLLLVIAAYNALDWLWRATERGPMRRGTRRQR